MHRRRTRIYNVSDVLFRVADCKKKDKKKSKSKKRPEDDNAEAAAAATALATQPLSSDIKLLAEGHSHIAFSPDWESKRCGYHSVASWCLRLDSIKWLCFDSVSVFAPPLSLSLPPALVLLATLAGPSSPRPSKRVSTFPLTSPRCPMLLLLLL